MDRVEDVPQVEAAMRLLQNMLDKKFICHASGNPSFPFRNGLHFYFIVQPNTPKPGLASPLACRNAFSGTVEANAILTNP
jgi:hypothetical protein